MSLTVPLLWTRPPLSGNDRGHTRYRAPHIVAAHDSAAADIRRAKLPRLAGAEVTLHWRIPDRRRRDADNLAPTLKVVLDALVRAKVLPDDSWVHVPSASCRIHEPSDAGPAMWVELEPLGERP